MSSTEMLGGTCIHYSDQSVRALWGGVALSVLLSSANDAVIPGLGP